MHFKYLGLLAVLPALASIQDDKNWKKKLDAEIDDAIRKGVDFLISKQESDGWWKQERSHGPGDGYGALAFYALIRSKDKIKDKTKLKEYNEAIKKAEKYALDWKIKPPRSYEGVEQYAIALHIMILEALDPKKHKARIKKFAEHLLARQSKDGCWGYGKIPDEIPELPEKPDKTGYNPDEWRKAELKHADVSLTQYALLGLWAAEHSNAVKIDKRVWQDALKWIIKPPVFDDTTGWGICCIQETQRAPGFSLNLMSAGIGSVMICTWNLDKKDYTTIKKEAVQEILKKACDLLEPRWKDEKDESTC